MVGVSEGLSGAVGLFFDEQEPKKTAKADRNKSADSLRYMCALR